MNLNELQAILRDKLKCPESRVVSITNILTIIRHNDSRLKGEIIEIIEKDSKNATPIN